MLLLINVGVTDCHNKPFFFNVNQIGYDFIKDVMGGGYTLTFTEKELIINASGNMKVTITVKGPLQGTPSSRRPFGPLCLLRPEDT